MKSDDWRGEMLTRYPDLTTNDMRELESLHLDCDRQVDAMVRWVRLRDQEQRLAWANVHAAHDAPEVREFWWLSRVVSAIGVWRRE